MTSRVERVTLGYLLALALLLTVAMAAFPRAVPTDVLVVPLVLGSLMLGPRTLPWFVVIVMAMIAVETLVTTTLTSLVTLRPVDATGAGVVFVLGLMVLLIAFRRARLGVAELRGESMFVELRDRILRQGRLPELPAGWDADMSLASAGGTLFAGDFLVAVQPSPDRLEVALVDVSGKGEDAGTRALLLSGAFGGLLGAVPARSFLPAANDYVLRQGWAEGFATAVHLSVDLTTGAYEVRTAGHPPALRRIARDHEWVDLATSGPVLGVMPDAEFSASAGTLGPGDAVMLYTDGMVEERRRDIEHGVRRLAREAESRFERAPNIARTLVDALGSKDDDRALLVLRRTTSS